MISTIENSGAAGTGGVTLQKRPARHFLVYERVKDESGKWLRRAKRDAPDASGACERWFSALGPRFRQTTHYVGLVEISSEDPWRKTRKTLADDDMRKHSCYLFIGYGPGRLTFWNARRKRKTGAPLPEWHPVI